jgi:succinylglutamic semialdehyde dehydrogenase
MSVFGGTREEFEALAPRLQAGVVSWNLPTAGASSRLPFGGIKDSGNHRPSALFSPLYCTFPQALQYGSSAPGPRPAGVRAE